MEGQGRPEVTAAVATGVCTLLAAHGFAPLLEVALANGRRADAMGIGPRGEVWIVETKSGLADYAADGKWPDYLDFCDAFFFGVAEGFPLEILPDGVGVIVADRYGGEIIRPAPVRPLAGARRKAVTLRFARTAAMRLSGAG